MPFLRFGASLSVQSALGVNYFRREQSDRAYSGLAGIQQITTSAAAAIPQNTLMAMAYLVGNAQRIVKAGVEIAGAGAGNIRFGIYSNTSLSNPYPATLLWDSGDLTPAGVGRTYSSVAPMPLSLTARTLYWFAVVLPAGQTRSYATPNRAFIPSLGRSPTVSWATGGGASAASIWRVAFAYAALPATFPAGAVPEDTNTAPQCPVVSVVPG